MGDTKEGTVPGWDASGRVDAIRGGDGNVVGGFLKGMARRMLSVDELIPSEISSIVGLTGKPTVTIQVPLNSRRYSYLSEHFAVFSIAIDCEEIPPGGYPERIQDTTMWSGSDSASHHENESQPGDKRDCDEHNSDANDSDRASEDSENRGLPPETGPLHGEQSERAKHEDRDSKGATCKDGQMQAVGPTKCGTKAGIDNGGVEDGNNGDVDVGDADVGAVGKNGESKAEGNDSGDGKPSDDNGNSSDGGSNDAASSDGGETAVSYSFEVDAGLRPPYSLGSTYIFYYDPDKIDSSDDTPSIGEAGKDSEDSEDSSIHDDPKIENDDADADSDPALAEGPNDAKAEDCNRANCDDVVDHGFVNDAQKNHQSESDKSDAAVEQTSMIHEHGEAGESAEMEEDEKADEDEEAVSVHNLRTRREFVIPDLLMGTGYGKLQVRHLNERGERRTSTVVGRQTTLLHTTEGGDRRPYPVLVLQSTSLRAILQYIETANAWKRTARLWKKRSGLFFMYTLNPQSILLWTARGYHNARPPRSIIQKRGLIRSILEDVGEFYHRDTRNWYNLHGLPYRRALLFHGPPGCGKTSTIRMLAGYFDLELYYLSVTGSSFSTDTLHEALSLVPTGTLLVLEDVDAILRAADGQDVTVALTLSGLLNAMDGLVSAPSGVLTIYTTNHLERLPPAVIRAGRIDRRFEFAAADHETMTKLFRSYYPDTTLQLAKKFADIVFARSEPEARTVATLQQHFVNMRRHDAQHAVDMLPAFLDEFFKKSTPVIL